MTKTESGFSATPCSSNWPLSPRIADAMCGRMKSCPAGPIISRIVRPIIASGATP